MRTSSRTRPSSSSRGAARSDDGAPEDLARPAVGASRGVPLCRGSGRVSYSAADDDEPRLTLGGPCGVRRLSWLLRVVLRLGLRWRRGGTALGVVRVVVVHRGQVLAVERPGLVRLGHARRLRSLAGAQERSAEREAEAASRGGRARAVCGRGAPGAGRWYRSDQTGALGGAAREGSTPGERNENETRLGATRAARWLSLDPTPRRRAAHLATMNSIVRGSRILSRSAHNVASRAVAFVPPPQRSPRRR